MAPWRPRSCSFHTLVDTEHLRPTGFDEMSAIADATGTDVSIVRQAWRDGYIERETTTVDPVDHLIAGLTAAGHRVTAGARGEIDRLLGVTRDDALLHPDPEIVSLVADLAEEHAIAVLSNCHEREIRRWPDSPLAPLVDHFVASSRIGVMKPTVEAYVHACNLLNLAPHYCVFVGNGSSEELVGARRAGFDTVVHANHFDRHNGLVTRAEQRQRVSQADASADTIADLRQILRPDPA